MASSTPGAGAARSMPTATKRCAGTAARIRTHHSWKCTARGPVPSPSSTTTWVSTGVSLIGSSVTRWSGSPHRAARRAVTSESGTPWPQPLAADDVGGEVAVAEAEPLRHGAVRGELLLHGVRLVDAPPALLLVDAAAEGVHHRVQVGADPQAEQGDVVAGVADDGDGRVGEGRACGRGGRAAPAGTARRRRHRPGR